MDTLLLFEACRQGILPKVTRRLQDRERKDLVVSGTVFIFDERESGIKRWTDGLLWSPSRILGNFLVYREIDKRSPIVDKRQQPVDHNAPTSTAERLKERALVGSLTNSYKFKRNGLIKKTMSIVVNGSTQHMISYYNKEDVASGRLQCPRNMPMIANLEVSPEFLQRQNFRIPLHVETGGMPDRTSTSPTLSSVYYDSQRRESQASTSSDLMSSDSNPIDTRNYLQPQMRQGYNGPPRYPQYQYVDPQHAHNYPSVSMPNTPIPSPSAGYRVRKSSDPAMLYHNRGHMHDPLSQPSRHPFASTSSPNQQVSSRGAAGGLELHGMPPPSSHTTVTEVAHSNEAAAAAAYNSMNMNWSNYRPDQRSPTTAGPYEAPYSFPSQTPRHNYHHRHHSDPRYEETTNNMSSYSHTHLPPIMQTNMMSAYSTAPTGTAGSGDMHHQQPPDPAANVPPFDDSYRGGGGHHHESMHQGLLEHNSMRMPPYPTAQDPRSNNSHDQFNNVPTGSNFNAPDLQLTLDQWNTYK
ncbi:Global transcription regulator sge1 [Umbelopsis nana]